MGNLLDSKRWKAVLMGMAVQALVIGARRIGLAVSDTEAGSLLVPVLGFILGQSWSDAHGKGKVEAAIGLKAATLNELASKPPG